jgi:pimeloyl-ACP methyl ester carboxylesterase
MLDSFPRPSRYKGDALLIWGEFDQAFPPKQILPKFQEILPQAELVIIPKTKHCPHHERAGDVNAAIAQFLRRADTRD